MSATIGDVARTARAIGSGELISRRASRQRFAPAAGGISQLLPGMHFGLGIVVAGDWRIQNPMLNGYRLPAAQPRSAASRGAASPPGHARGWR